MHRTRTGEVRVGGIGRGARLNIQSLIGTWLRRSGISIMGRSRLGTSGV
jgi:hypothetical protein